MRDAKGADSDTKPGHLIPVIGGGFDDRDMQLIRDGSPIAFAQNQRNEVRAVAVAVAGALAAEPGMKQQTYVAVDYESGAFEQAEQANPITTSADRSRAAPIVAFSCKDHGADAGDTAPTLRAMGHGASHANGGGQVAIAIDTAYTLEARSEVQAVQTAMQVRRLTPRECARLQGFPDNHLELVYADADEAHAAQVLHELWKEVATFAREGWRSGIVAALLSPEILLAGVYGGWISWALAASCAGARGQVSRPSGYGEGFLRSLWLAQEAGYSPYRRESFEQCARELGKTLPQLSLEETQARAVLRDSRLWPEAQRAWPLRYALATETQRRSGKLNPDGPRYKALGNSMAVPCMAWIGRQIADALSRPQPDAVEVAA